MTMGRKKWSIWYGNFVVDQEDDGVYIFEVKEENYGVRLRKKDHYVKIPNEELKELILALKEIYGRQTW